MVIDPMRPLAPKDNAPDGSLDCVILPLWESTLLLPKASLIETLDNTKLKIIVDSQGGVIGKLQWRGWTVPLLSFDAVADNSVPRFNAMTKAAIVYSNADNKAIPFLAITVQNDISHTRLYQHELDSVNNVASDKACVLMAFDLDDEQVFVPDFDALMQYVQARI